MAGFYCADSWVQRRTGWHRTTIARRRRAGAWPPWLLRLARLELDGELGLISEAWRGFVLDRRRSVLVTPYSLELTPGDLKALPWKLALLKEREVAS